MKRTESRKITLNSHVELGEENMHLKTVITLPMADSKYSEEAVAIAEKAHDDFEEIAEHNQTNMFDDDPPEDPNGKDVSASFETVDDDESGDGEDAEEEEE